jgi:hypothetical protein
VDTGLAQPLLADLAVVAQDIIVVQDKDQQEQELQDKDIPAVTDITEVVLHKTYHHNQVFVYMAAAEAAAPEKKDLKESHGAQKSRAATVWPIGLMETMLITPAAEPVEVTDQAETTGETVQWAVAEAVVDQEVLDHKHF